MNLAAWLFALFEALAAIAQLAGLMRELASKIAAWYLAEQEEETLRGIIDAANFAARAKTQEERFQAAQKWREALSRRRYVE